MTDKAQQQRCGDLNWLGDACRNMTGHAGKCGDGFRLTWPNPQQRDALRATLDSDDKSTGQEHD